MLPTPGPDQLRYCHTQTCWPVQRSTQTALQPYRTGGLIADDPFRSCQTGDMELGSHLRDRTTSLENLLHGSVPSNNGE